MYVGTGTVWENPTRGLPVLNPMSSHADHVTCRTCGKCTPEVRKLIFMDNDGTVYMCTIYNCQTNAHNILICTMEDIKDTPRQYRYRLVKPTGTVTHPEREDGEDLYLAGYVIINGVKAYTLFDSGSTTDAVSPDFARVSNVPILRLDKPATLQLGCSGSRSKINFTTIAVVEFGSTTAKNYLDIANLDKYDCILGMPFLRKHGISLDFQFQEIVIRGKLCIPALPEGKGMSTTKPIRRGK